MWKCFIRNFEGVSSSGITDEEIIKHSLHVGEYLQILLFLYFPLNREWLRSRLMKRPFHGRRHFLLFFSKRRAPHCLRLTGLIDPVAA